MERAELKHRVDAVVAVAGPNGLFAARAPARVDPRVKGHETAETAWPGPFEPHAPTAAKRRPR